jgi:uncharacterized damage-inducible protein DinB
MIDAAYVALMARYNRWQNENLFCVATLLSEEERRRERGVSGRFTRRSVIFCGPTTCG